MVCDILIMVGVYNQIAIPAGNSTEIFYILHNQLLFIDILLSYNLVAEINRAYSGIWLTYCP